MLLHHLEWVVLIGSIACKSNMTLKLTYNVHCTHSTTSIVYITSESSGIQIDELNRCGVWVQSFEANILLVPQM